VDADPQTKMPDGPSEGDRPTDRVEALADAWASIDGKATRFRLCRDNPEAEDLYGSYGGYMADAQSIIDRLDRRGFVILAKEAVDGR
jgi:hypothetical protein